jgi:shikimate dehydrogenase
VYDLVYNPEETLFLQQARTQGAKTHNGLAMLYAQAEEAWRIFG